MSRLRAKEKELAALENRLMSAESQANAMQSRMNDAIADRRKWEDEYNVR